MEEVQPTQNEALTTTAAQAITSQDEIKYAARLKLFGERAQRVTKDEYPTVIAEIMTKAQGSFLSASPVEQLADKESFGDLDIVCLPNDKINQDSFESIFGDSLHDYHRNGHINSLLVELTSGKTVQVDFIQAEDEKDYRRKQMYYSKGHLSSIIGVLSKKLNFKYGTEGFFKRFKDSKGNWHDTLITGDLTEGLQILGLQPESYEKIHTIEDIIEFIASSPFFDNINYQLQNLLGRDKEQYERTPTQRYMINRLAGKQKKIYEDEDQLFREMFPKVYEEYQQKTTEIDKQIKQRKAINGQLIMQTFGLTPGPQVWKVVRFLNENYPDIESLTDNVIDRIKNELLTN